MITLNNAMSVTAAGNFGPFNIILIIAIALTVYGLRGMHRIKYTKLHENYGATAVAEITEVNRNILRSKCFKNIAIIFEDKWGETIETRVRAFHHSYAVGEEINVFYISHDPKKAYIEDALPTRIVLEYICYFAGFLMLMYCAFGIH